MDADGEFALEIDEMKPFFEMVFKLMFNIQLDEPTMESLFHLMDTDCRLFHFVAACLCLSLSLPL